MLARTDGPNAWGPQFRSPSNSAFEGPLPPGQLRLFPRIDMIDRVLTRVASSLEEYWSGPHVRFCLFKSWKPGRPKLAFFEHIILWPAGLSLFLGRIHGFPQVIRDADKMARAVFRPRSRA